MNEIQRNEEHTQGNALAQNFNVFSLLRFAFPTITMMLFMGFYTIVDTIFVSRFVNIDALSAINIVCPVTNIIVGIGTMLATGGSAVVAYKMGIGKEKRAKQDFTLIILAGAVIGIGIACVGIIFINNIVWGLGASKILYPYCKDYLFILLLFTPAAMLQVLFQTFIVTAGKPGFGMILSFSAGAINVFLDYIFMVPLKMGISGAALGTGIGYLIPTVIGILFFRRKKGTLHFHKPIVDLKILGLSCFNGSSEMVSQIATAITTFLFNATMMKILGESGVAAITIIIYTQFLLITLYIGFSMGVAPIISYNYGSNNHVRLKRIFFICLLFIGSVSIFIFTFAMIFGSVMVGVFSPIGSNVYAIAKEGFYIYTFSVLFCGFNIFTSATFTALSNGKISAVISFLRTFGFTTIGLLVLPNFLKVIGVWLAVPLAEFLTLLLSFGFILYYRKRYHYL